MEFLFAQVQSATPEVPVGLLLIQGLQGIVGLGSLVCLIIVIVKMFQNDQVGLGVFSICCGLVAFIVGWMNADRWGIRNVMLIWTVLFIVGIILGVIGFALTPVVISPTDGFPR